MTKTRTRSVFRSPRTASREGAGTLLITVLTALAVLTVMAMMQFFASNVTRNKRVLHQLTLATQVGESAIQETLVWFNGSVNGFGNGFRAPQSEQLKELHKALITTPAGSAVSFPPIKYLPNATIALYRTDESGPKIGEESLKIQPVEIVLKIAEGDDARSTSGATGVIFFQATVSFGESESSFFQKITRKVTRAYQFRQAVIVPKPALVNSFFAAKFNYLVNRINLLVDDFKAYTAALKQMTGKVRWSMHLLRYIVAPAGERPDPAYSWKYGVDFADAVKTAAQNYTKPSDDPNSPGGTACGNIWESDGTGACGTPNPLVKDLEREAINFKDWHPEDTDSQGNFYGLNREYLKAMADCRSSGGLQRFVDFLKNTPSLAGDDTTQQPFNISTDKWPSISRLSRPLCPNRNCSDCESRRGDCFIREIGENGQLAPIKKWYQGPAIGLSDRSPPSLNFQDVNLLEGALPAAGATSGGAAPAAPGAPATGGRKVEKDSIGIQYPAQDGVTINLRDKVRLRVIPPPIIPVDMTGEIIGTGQPQEPNDPGFAGKIKVPTYLKQFYSDHQQATAPNDALDAMFKEISEAGGGSLDGSAGGGGGAAGEACGKQGLSRLKDVFTANNPQPIDEDVKAMVDAALGGTGAGPEGIDLRSYYFDLPIPPYSQGDWCFRIQYEFYKQGFQPIMDAYTKWEKKTQDSAQAYFAGIKKEEDRLAPFNKKVEDADKTWWESLSADDMRKWATYRFPTQAEFDQSIKIGQKTYLNGVYVLEDATQVTLPALTYRGQGLILGTNVTLTGAVGPEVPGTDGRLTIMALEEQSRIDIKDAPTIDAHLITKGTVVTQPDQGGGAGQVANKITGSLMVSDLPCAAAFKDLQGDAKPTDNDCEKAFLYNSYLPAIEITAPSINRDDVFFSHITLTPFRLANAQDVDR